MNTRQEELFIKIIKEHIKTAKAVGSELLANKYNMGVSSATIRNDMAELEGLGFIGQPHTSAGRVPTEKGYRYYIDNYLKKDIEISSQGKKELDKILEELPNDVSIKDKALAKAIAKIADTAVIVAWSKDDVYYTGIANLLSQPEFEDFNLIHNISAVVDRCEGILEDIFDKVEGTEIKIGKENYFSPQCASIITKSKNRLISILGPMRMDYEKNLSLINYVNKI